MTKVFKIISDIIFILLIVFLTTYFVLRFLGFAEIYKVQTGSMEDGIHAGDYILIYKKNQYDIGDVVTYKKENYYITHRIVKKNGNKIVTKGDANNIVDDEISTKSVVGMVVYNGGYLNFIIDYKYAIASVLLAIYLFSCYFEKKVNYSDDDNIVQNDENLSEETIEEKVEDKKLSDEITENDEAESDIEDSLEENVDEDKISDEIELKDLFKDN